MPTLFRPGAGGGSKPVDSNTVKVALGYALLWLNFAGINWTNVNLILFHRRGHRDGEMVETELLDFELFFFGMGWTSLKKSVFNE